MGSRPGYLVTASLFWNPVLSGLGLERLWGRKATGVVAALCLWLSVPAAELSLFLSPLLGLPDVANENTQLKSKIKSSFIKI